MRKNADFVFITLVYRYFEDLYTFCDSLKMLLIRMKL